MLSTRHRSLLVRLAALLLAVACTVIIINLAVHRELGQRWDHMAMLHVQLGNQPPLSVLSFLSRASIIAMTVLAILGIVLSLVHRSFHRLLDAVVLFAGANITTQLLKHQWLERTDLGWGTHNSLPSGHTTLVASAAAVLLITTAERWRPWATAIASAATAFTGLATIVAGWHRPSDVLVALAITLGWTAVVTLTGEPRRPSRTHVTPAVIGVVSALALLVVLGLQHVTWQNLSVLAVVALTTAVWTWMVSAIAPARQP